MLNHAVIEKYIMIYKYLPYVNYYHNAAALWIDVFVSWYEHIYYASNASKHVGGRWRIQMT